MVDGNSLREMEEDRNVPPSLCIFGFFIYISYDYYVTSFIGVADYMSATIQSLKFKHKSPKQRSVLKNNPPTTCQLSTTNKIDSTYDVNRKSRHYQEVVYSLYVNIAINTGFVFSFNCPLRNTPIKGHICLHDEFNQNFLSQTSRFHTVLLLDVQTINRTSFSKNRYLTRLMFKYANPLLSFLFQVLIYGSGLLRGRYYDYDGNV